MDWNDRLHVAVDAVFGNGEPPPRDNVSSLSRRRTTADDIDGFTRAATNRDNPLFADMDAFLEGLHHRYPYRARKLQKELRWLRNLAAKEGLPWGKKTKWWER